MEEFEFGETAEEIFSDRFLTAMEVAARSLDPKFGSQPGRVEHQVSFDDEQGGERRTYEFIARCMFGPGSLNSGDLRCDYSISTQLELSVDGSASAEGSVAHMLDDSAARVVIDTEYSIDTDNLSVEKSQTVFFALSESSAVGHIDMRDEAEVTAEQAAISDKDEDTLYDIQNRAEAEEVNDILDYLGFIGNYIVLGDRV